jgi:hypothetical protein
MEFLHILGLAHETYYQVSTLNDVGVQVVFSNKGCKMVQGAMVLTKGVHVGTLFQLDACTIQCNSSSIFVVERSIGSTPSQSNLYLLMVMLSGYLKTSLA